MPLVDLIIQDLNKSITDAVESDSIDPDQFSHQEDAYFAGVDAAREGAEKYLREIFPEA